MTPRRGVTGDGQNLSPAIPREIGLIPGDRNARSSHPPEISTHETPGRWHKSIDVTGGPGDRTAISTTRDVRDEKTHTPAIPCDPMCPHIGCVKFRAHHVEGRNLPPDHPDPPAHQCICAPDQHNQTASAPNPSPGEPGTNPRDPEPIGPLAAKYLDQLAAQQADPDLAARQAEALNRLRRQKPAIRAKEKP